MPTTKGSRRFAPPSGSGLGAAAAPVFDEALVDQLQRTLGVSAERFLGVPLVVNDEVGILAVALPPATQNAEDRGVEREDRVDDVRAVARNSVGRLKTRRRQSIAEHRRALPR